MSRKVCVKICGLHSIDCLNIEDDTIEVIYIGTHYKRNGKHYIRYEEIIEGSEEITPSSTLLKISGDEVELISHGGNGSHMIFTRGQKNMSYYNTTLGMISLGVDTYDMNVDVTDNAIVVDLKYGLEVNLDFLTNCHVHIEVDFTD